MRQSEWEAGAHRTIFQSTNPQSPVTQAHQHQIVENTEKTTEAPLGVEEAHHKQSDGELDGLTVTRNEEGGEGLRDTVTGQSQAMP
jgi:hypothetical protein